MGQFLLLLVVALTVAAVVFGVTALVSGTDNGLSVAEPDGRAVPLPGTRPLVESDVTTVRFDTALRGYRMAQVDQALRRAAYDIGYKDELISVLEAEVTALREGRTSDAEVLRRAREAAIAPQPAATPAVATPQPAEATLAEPASGPAEQAEQAEHAEPSDAEQRVEPDEPIEPVEPAESAGRDDAVEPAKLAGSDEPAEPVELADEPAEPVELADERAAAAESTERR